MYKESQNEREVPRSDLEFGSLLPNMFDDVEEMFGGRGQGK